ncbi:MAG: hypothetical protein AAGE13_12935 [Pseudomonadota bacterium]
MTDRTDQDALPHPRNASGANPDRAEAGMGDDARSEMRLGTGPGNGQGTGHGTAPGTGPKNTPDSPDLDAAPRRSTMRAAFDGMGWRGRVRGLLRLLARERQLMRAGDLDGLTALEARRSNLIEGVLRVPPPPGADSAAMLSQLRAEAARNQRLTAAFLEGVRSAARDVAEMSRAPRRIGLYSPQGALSEPPAAAQTDRRA